MSYAARGAFAYHRDVSKKAVRKPGGNGPPAPAQPGLLQQAEAQEPGKRSGKGVASLIPFLARPLQTRPATEPPQAPADTPSPETARPDQP